VSPSPVRLLLVGHGRMGRLIDSLSSEYGCEVVGRVTSRTTQTIARARGAADVALDFSTAEAFLTNFPAMAEAGLNVVVGTTGWLAREEEVRRCATAARIGVVAAANFSPGLTRFLTLVNEAARRFQGSDFGAWIHEAHHRTKRDAPSGTALMLKHTMEGAGYTGTIDVSSTRAGAIPGIHTVGFDQASETITLTHTVRDRSTFAHGALQAARWVVGREGWFSMKDVLESRD
jgi:4-hydroxy-tetrahydrodipicolinate reductase